jgi:branched-chain amino acid transport system permease protein
MITKVLIFGIFAMSLDLIWGCAGLLSLGHAAYFGLGGYGVGILTLHYGIDNFWITAPVGILMAATTAAIFGIVVLRASGSYFLLITSAVGQLLFSVAWKWRWLSSGGAEGIAGIPRPDIGIPSFTWNSTTFYYFILIAFGVCFFILYRIVKSPFGLALQGIREHETRMRVLGYNTWFYKFIAFVIAGAFAGVAGVLFVYHNGIIVPEHLALSNSTLPVLMAVIGGVGTLYGPVIGAAVIIPLEFYAGIVTPERWPLILGSAFILAILYFPGGIGTYLTKVGKVLSSRWKS